MNDEIMKLTAIALAFVLFSTVALANTNHLRSVVRNHRSAVSMVYPHPNVGNPDGPTTFSGSAKTYAIPGWTNGQTQYWIDSATGPKD
jgi:hypothetical protein